MKILVTGANGMLGRTQLKVLGQAHEVVGTDLPDCDLGDVHAIDALVGAVKPQVVIHGAAYTAVDACEENEDLALRVNGIGSANLARACSRHGARCIAISTDYVFDGLARRPYHEWDTPCPRSAYGRSKLAGELAIQRHCADHTIVRIAWLYGAGGPSFVHTMLKLGAQGGDPLKVVNDQIGNPTSCQAVAELCRRLVEQPLPGIVHGTCEGAASWYDFTGAILEEAGLARGVEPCSSAQFPRPAPRPSNSRLEKRALRVAGFEPMPHWRDALSAFLRDHPQG